MERDITDESFAEAIYNYCMDMEAGGYRYWVRYELEPISMLQYVFSYELEEFWRWYDEVWQST